LPRCGCASLSHAALRKALRVEVYPEARAAEVAALQALGDAATAERLRKQSEALAAKK